VKDFLGRDIVAGNTVVYPIRKGSSMWMKRMTVVGTEHGVLTGNSPEGRRITLTNISNVTVVEAPKPEVPA
jgi:hypothetical protein